MIRKNPYYTEIDSYGDKFWYFNGKRHRVDGPAIEYSNGTKYWYLNGNIHRVDGPAIEYSDGDKQWFLNGIEYTEVKYNKEINKKEKIK